MSGHTRWEDIAPLPDKRGLEVQMAYVQGYLLALEDINKDLAVMLFPAPEREETEHERLRRIFLFRRYRKEIRRKISESYNSAKRTMRAFQDKYEGKNDGSVHSNDSAQEAGQPPDL